MIMKDFSVTFLGISAAIPAKNRNLSAQVVHYAGNVFLIDCGEGTQMQLKHYKIKTGKINHIFISHLHGDHFYGLIGLISTFHLMGRSAGLHIYGPEPLESVIRLQLDVSKTELRYPLFFHTVDPDRQSVVYEDHFMEVRSLPMIHRIPCTGFYFIEKPLNRRINLSAAAYHDVPVKAFESIKLGKDFVKDDGTVIANSVLTHEPAPARSYALCADTLYHESVAQLIKGCDLMFHEATFMKDMENVAAEKMHSTAEQAAKIAVAAEAGQLVLGHFSARYENLLPLLEEATAVFSNSFLAEEGHTVMIKSGVKNS